MPVLNRFDDDRTEDNPYGGGMGDRRLSMIVELDGFERLFPPAPAGWCAVVDLQRHRAGHPLEIGIWISMLADIQHRSRCWAAAQGDLYYEESTADLVHRYCYRVVRDDDGRRVLIVGPHLRGVAASLVNDLDAHLEECPCGGYRCLNGFAQRKFAHDQAKRFWIRARPTERMRCRDVFERLGIPDRNLLLSADWLLELYEEPEKLWEIAEAIVTPPYRRSAA